LARHLSKHDVQAIVNLIRGWQDGKLTWEAICEAAEPLVGKKPTRQSLNAHEPISSAYTAAKKGLKNAGPKKPRPSSLNAASARIANLERALEELKAQSQAYKQLFVMWQYNAYKYGMKEHQLNESLPFIDRERSDGSKR